MKFVLTWELGRGHGHQFQLEWLARGLNSRGHETQLVSSEESGYQQFFNTNSTGPAHKSWADLLLVNGFGDREFIRQRLNFWEQRLQQLKPDALVVDHSPYAHLLAFARQIPCMEFGSAFTLPPPGDITGPFDNSSPPYQEQRLLENINACMAAKQWPQLTRLADLYRCSRLRCATGIPMLDHYGPRTDIAYTGAFAAGTGLPLEWGADQTGKVKVLIYWRDGTALDGFLRRLDPAKFIVRAYAPDTRLSFTPDSSWSVGATPLDITHFSAATLPDFAVGYASNAFIQWMAHWGVPQLMSPVYREGLMQGTRAQQLGLGLLCSNSQADDLLQKFAHLTADPTFTQQARAFSHYSRRHWDAGPRLSALVKLMEQRLVD